MHITTSLQENMDLGIGTYSCNRGTDFCGLYESDQKYNVIISGFLSQRYKDCDRQLYSPAERTIEQFYTSFIPFCLSCSVAIHDRGHFPLMDAKLLSYLSGIFDLWNMDRTPDTFYSMSQKNGRCTICTTAEMAWALDAIPRVEHLMVYEVRLNYFISGKPRSRICMYNVNKFPGTTILNLLKTHLLIINGGISTKNSLFIHPDKWLADNVPQFLSKN